VLATIPDHDQPAALDAVRHAADHRPPRQLAAGI
jgi:hypothetical protein